MKPARRGGIPSVPALAAALAVSALALVSCAERGGAAAPARPSTLSAAPSAAPASPAPGRAAAPSPCPGIRVRPGDSLWTLARRGLGSGFLWRRLAEANGLARPWTLEPGSVLRLPCGASRGPSGRRAGAARAWSPVPDRAYGVGEELDFAVRYADIPAGDATLSIVGVERRDGRPVYHIRATAQSRPFFDAFFRVRDRLDSYLDRDYAFSWGYEKHLHEGGFKSDAVYDYDQRAGLIREPAKGTHAPLPPAAQDVLSCYYYFRDLTLAPGAAVDIPVTADDMKSYVLRVSVLGRQRVQTPAGTFDCLMVRPRLAFQGVFRQKGEVLMWVTDDPRHLPVLIRSKIVIGSISIVLQRARWTDPSAAAPPAGAPAPQHQEPE